MWRWKAVFIFRRVLSAINSSPNIRPVETNKVRIAATTHQNQVVSAIHIRLYSSASIHIQNVENCSVNTASYIENKEPYDSDKPLTGNTETLENSQNPEIAKRCVEDVEKVVYLLQKKLEVEELETKLQTLDLNINGKMIAKVVKTPGFSTEQFVRFFRWAVKQPNYVPSSRTMDTITMAICNKGGRKGLELLKNLIEDIAENQKGVITTPALNTLIDYLGCAKRAKMAIEVFQQFDKFECKPGPKSYFVTINGLCMNSMFDEALSVFEQMEKVGYFPGNGSTASKIIRLFCKGNRPNDAHMIYLKSIQKGKLPRLVAINALVHSLCNVAVTPDVAAEILRAIPRKERKHTLKSHFAVVLALCNNRRIEEAEAVLSQMVRVGPRPDRATYNAIITAFCRAEKAEEAMELLEQMTSRRIKPDIYTYNVIMASFARAGKMQEACDVFSKAKEANIKFHFITYKILIDGFCRLGDPEKAHQYFSELKESGRSPNNEIYSKLVTAYTTQGMDCHTVEKLLQEMEKKGHSTTMCTQSLVHSTKELEVEALPAQALRVKARCVRR